MITSDTPEKHRTILAGLAFGLLASPALAAQCGGTVSFPAGATGTVVKGSVSGLETCDYTLSARKGQTLRASLGDSRLDLIAVEPVEHDFVSGDALVLDRTGPVTLRVLQTRTAARQSQAARPFKLSVSIDSPLPKSKGAAQSAGTAAAPAVKTAGKPAAKAAGNQCEGSSALTGGPANRRARSRATRSAATPSRARPASRSRCCSTPPPGSRSGCAPRAPTPPCRSTRRRR
ncbi:hypothetical protein [Paracoccus sanguinis]|uniref:hypothetical protein n=1 Tax=Paracoccus sanguinis TaxID=1545044 RepID=UPI000B10A85A|nr:hypothetical protein [Paracoccus sanguinis]